MISSLRLMALAALGIVFLAPGTTAQAARVWPVSDEAFKTGPPGLAVRGDEGLIAWSEDQGRVIRMRRVDTAGRPLDAIRDLAAAPTQEHGQALAPAVARGRAGYLAAWLAEPQGIAATAMGTEAQPRSVRVIGASRGRPSIPRVAFNPVTHEYAVVWSDVGATAEDEALFVRRIAADGDPIGSARRVSYSRGRITDYAIAVNPRTGGYVLAWSGRGDGVFGVMGRTLSRRARPNARVRLLARATELSDVGLTWTGHPRGFALAWSAESSVDLRRLDSAARPARGRVVSIDAISDQRELRDVSLVQQRRSRTVLVVWREQAEFSDAADLYARVRDASDLSARGAPAIPSRTPSPFVDESAAAVAPGSGSGFLASWAGERGDGTSSRVFAQRL